MSVPLPRTPRIASPGYHRSIGFDVLALAAAGFLLPLAPGFGGWVMLVCLALAFVVATRRPTVGAYDAQDGLVVRNFLRTHRLSWANVAGVRVTRDGVFPWLRVPVVVLNDRKTVPVTGLRHFGEPNQDVLTLTRVVREGRDGLSREVWRD